MARSRRSTPHSRQPRAEPPRGGRRRAGAPRRSGAASSPPARRSDHPPLTHRFSRRASTHVRRYACVASTVERSSLIRLRESGMTAQVVAPSPRSASSPPFGPDPSRAAARSGSRSRRSPSRGSAARARRAARRSAARPRSRYWHRSGSSVSIHRGGCWKAGAGRSRLPHRSTASPRDSPACPRTRTARNAAEACPAGDTGRGSPR